MHFPGLVFRPRVRLWPSNARMSSCCHSNCVPGSPQAVSRVYQSVEADITLSLCDVFTEPAWTVVCNIDFITHTAEPGCCTAAFKWDIRLLFLFFSIGFHGTLFPPHSMDPHRETEEINKRKNHTQLHTHSLTSGFILAGSSRDADTLEGFPHASIRQE